MDESIPPEVFFLVEDIHPKSEILHDKYANAWFSVIHDTRKGGVSKVEIEYLKLYARLNNGKDILLMFSDTSDIKWDGKLYIRYPYFEYSLNKQLQWKMPSRLENGRLTFNPSDITNRVWHGWCIGPWPKVPVNTKRLWIKVKAKITGNALMQIGVDLKTDQNTNDNWEEYGVSDWFFATNNFQEVFFNKP